MDREKYKIGRISDLIGLTPEALRFYEREGIIAPEKSPESGYRMYSAWDLHMLIRARTYRRYGFTLEETVCALNTDCLDDLEYMLNAKACALEEIIDDRQWLLRQLRHDRRAIRDVLDNQGKFRVEYSPAMRFIDTQRYYDIMDDKFDLYSTWIDRVPYVNSGGIFELGHESPLRYGLVAEDATLSSWLSEEFLKDTVHLPSRLCFTTFFRSGSNRELGPHLIDYAFDYMESHGLKVVGNPFVRAVLMARASDGHYRSWYQGWIPFEGDCMLAPSNLPPEDGR